MAQIAVFAVIFLVMYAALIYPQQRRQKENRAMLASISEGDEVLLTSGIHAFITAIDGNIVWVEVAPDVELKVAREAIGGVVADPPESDEGD